MAPNSTDANGVLCEMDAATPDLALPQKPVNKDEKLHEKLVWSNIIFVVVWHLLASYGLYLLVFKTKWQTNLFALFLYIIGGLGITAGVHRLWAHRSYKAKWPLRLFLVICNCVSFQASILRWARDHRMHHKFSDTHADPHNSTRGIFFSHVGWLFFKKHEELKTKGKGLDLSDLYADPIVVYQNKYYYFVMPIFCFILPTVVPAYYWNESYINAFYVAGILRHTLVLNGTWLVNSAAHKWGMKPYDKNMKPADTLPVSFITLGEGSHNYHHTFPWDYRTGELGIDHLNFTTRLINLFAKIGWAYDLKIASDDMIEKRILRTGDGSHSKWGVSKKIDQTNPIDLKAE